ncbi:gamma-glutamyltransferase [Sneathiella sp.]|uniref:gamma-glutamyltransferase n=1 Tax=Sneathiella sp. TaxID=1964365 RepID=UPI0026220806|nr:gamma-glutamyltransferase [Sneathiella sp.]MDF2368570.1 gamma-glutamyltransferase [Sneathiella sp.]
MTHGLIVAPQPEAVEAGALIMMKGGNCVDAAVACAFAQGVVDPQMCGIGGFGTLQVYLPKLDVHEILNFHAQAPAATKEDQWADLIEGETRDGFGFILKGRVNDLGYQAVAVPGSLKGYWDIHSAYGKLSWQDIIEPAITLAREGFTIRPHMHTYWRSNESKLGRVDMIEKLRFSEDSRTLYFNEKGELKEQGSVIKNPGLAQSLSVIAEQGADAFYDGPLTERIVDDFANNGGLLSREDLHSYQTKTTAPLWGSYRGLDIATNTPPGGGLMVLEILNILENFDLSALKHNSAEYLHLVAEAMKIATIDKEKFIGDPDFIDVPVDRLNSKSYAKECADRIRKGPLVHVERYSGPEESKDTTHITAMDETGGIVTMTHTLGYPSGAITTGLGFMYNGSMNIFDPRPGRPGSLAPGKSRFSAMAPTILFDKGEPMLALGAPGGTAITMAIAQVILNVVDFGMSITDAVAAPRISATSDVIDLVNRIPHFVTDELEAMGHKIDRSYQSYTLAAVHAIQIKDGKWIGGADPARDGMPLEV